LHACESLILRRDAQRRARRRARRRRARDAPGRARRRQRHPTRVRRSETHSQRPTRLTFTEFTREPRRQTGTAAAAVSVADDVARTHQRGVAAANEPLEAARGGGAVAPAAVAAHRGSQSHLLYYHHPQDVRDCGRSAKPDGAGGPRGGPLRPGRVSHSSPSHLNLNSQMSVLLSTLRLFDASTLRRFDSSTLRLFEAQNGPHQTKKCRCTRYWER